MEEDFPSKQEYLKAARKRGSRRSNTLPFVSACLILLLFLAVLVIVGLAVTVFYLRDMLRNTCDSSDCLVASSLVLSGLDESVDPCEDFYNFTCGKWAINNVIPEGEARLLCEPKIPELLTNGHAHLTYSRLVFPSRP